jgi:sigma-B regulation protein RsbU (phosphoserine phosphatase)
MHTPTILIVDDTPTNVDLLERLLSAEGFHTLTARDGPTARAASRAQHPELILLDVMMPGESGFETCALLKADPSTVDIPIVFLSALDSSEDRITGLNAGGVDYISKPVHRAEVLVRVRIHLRIREANRIVVQEHKERFQQLTAIQQGMLPKPADYPQASFAVFYRPLEAARGDVYDVVVIGSGGNRLLRR